MREQALRARPRRRGLPSDKDTRRGSGQRSGSAVTGHGAEPEVDRRLHIHLDSRGLALRGRRHRPVLASCRRMVDERHDDGPVGRGRIDDGDLAPWEAGCAAASFGPGQPI